MYITLYVIKGKSSDTNVEMQKGISLFLTLTWLARIVYGFQSLHACLCRHVPINQTNPDLCTVSIML